MLENIILHFERAELLGQVASATRAGIVEKGVFEEIRKAIYN